MPFTDGTKPRVKIQGSEEDAGTEGSIANGMAGHEAQNEQPDSWQEALSASVHGTIMGTFSGRMVDPPPAPVQTRSPYHLRSAHPTEPTPGNFPLRLGSGGAAVYVPFQHRDMQGLVDKLPPLTEGASPWITTLENLTAGEVLCLGDMRALLARTEGSREAEKLLGEAGARRTRGNDEPFNTWRNELWEVLRKQYPTQRDLHSVKSLQMKDGEDVHEYLKRAEKVWEVNTGIRYDSSEAVRTLWRDHCQKGLPGPVQEKLEEVVGLGSKTDREWREHVTHWFRRYQAKKADEKDEVERLTKALLKQQVAEKSTQSKDRTKAKQMVVGTQEPDPEELQAVVTKAVQAALTAQQGVPPYGQAPPSPANILHPPQQQQSYMPQAQCAPRGGRGRFWERGGPRPNTQCHGCGSWDHWIRSCPHSHARSPQGGARGRSSFPRGGPMQRGGRGTSVPYPHQMPQSAWDQGVYHPHGQY